MITLRLGKKRYMMPTRWSELSPEDGAKFVSLCKAAGDFESGRITYEQLQVSTVLILLGLEKINPEEDGYKFENIYRLSRYTDGFFPVTSTDEGQTATAAVCMTENLLPKIGNFTGYRFRIHDGGVVDCDLRAEQYVDALSLMNEYNQTFNPITLRSLCQCLYVLPYDSLKSYDVDLHFSEAEQLAVYYNFRGILEYIKRIPSYDLIFRGSEKRQGPASPLGMSGTLFGIAKAGYGDIESIRKLDLFSYLGILVQMTVDSIKALAASKLKPGEIADKLSLEVEQVVPYLAGT